MDYVLLCVGFVLLTFAADWLVCGASGLAKRMNIPDLVIGLTVVAFGTSAPELVVNLVAASAGTNEIAITNILGSNTINTLVILGLSAVIYPISCQKSTFRYEIPFSILAGGMVLLLGYNCCGLTTGVEHGFVGLSRCDGIVLLVIFSCFMLYTVMQARHKGVPESCEVCKVMPVWKALLLVVVGLAGLICGGELIVNKAVLIARSWGVSEAVIGVTIVALGTSLPELATSVVAAIKHNTDLAIGNVIGSNIFNVFLILGISSTVSPLAVYDSFLLDALLAFGSSVLVFLLVAVSRKRAIGRLGGALMLAVYAAYLFCLLY